MAKIIVQCSNKTSPFWPANNIYSKPYLKDLHLGLSQDLLHFMQTRKSSCCYFVTTTNVEVLKILEHVETVQTPVIHIWRIWDV